MSEGVEHTGADMSLRFKRAAKGTVIVVIILLLFTGCYNTITGRLSNNFNEALVYAVGLHREQLRKGTQAPYICHLLSVCGLVLKYGGSEHEAKAPRGFAYVSPALSSGRVSDLNVRAVHRCGGAGGRYL